MTSETRLKEEACFAQGSLCYDKCLKCYENCRNIGENDISDVTIVSRQLRKNCKTETMYIGMRLKKAKRKKL